MAYGTFIPFNVLGALSWVWSMVLAGYYLPPLLKSVAPNFDLAANIDKIALLIVFLSILPILVTIWKERQARAVGVGSVISARSKPRKKAPKRR
jgi:membrane-associated protein